MNPYFLILLFFGLLGIGLIIWGYLILRRGLKTATWPKVEGVITHVDPVDSADDCFPEIIFSYSVDGQSFKQSLDFPSGTLPSEQLTRTYLDRYPVGTTVWVSIDPKCTEIVTLEPGVAKGDWMILVFGVLALLISVFSLLSVL